MARRFMQETKLKIRLYRAHCIGHSSRISCSITRHMIFQVLFIDDRKQFQNIISCLFYFIFPLPPRQAWQLRVIVRRVQCTFHLLFQYFLSFNQFIFVIKTYYYWFKLAGRLLFKIITDKAQDFADQHISHHHRIVINFGGMIN